MVRFPDRQRHIDEAGQTVVLTAIRDGITTVNTNTDATHTDTQVMATVLATLRDATIPATTAAVNALATLLTALTAKLAHQTRTDSYAATGTGTAIAFTTALSNFSIQCKGVGGALSAWIVLMEGSLDGVTYTTLLTHQTATGDGALVASVASSPVLYIRSRATTVTLGIGPTAISATILAAP